MSIVADRYDLCIRCMKEEHCDSEIVKSRMKNAMADGKGWINPYALAHGNGLQFSDGTLCLECPYILEHVILAQSAQHD